MEATQIPLVPDLAALVHLAHGPYGRRRHLLMLEAYCDESTNQRGHAYAVAGLLAPADNWNCFWGAWDRALQEEGIPELHWADCEGGYGSIFGGMDKTRREEIQRRFIGILTSPDYRLLGFAAGLDLEPYNAVREQIEKHRRRTPRSPINGSLGEPYFLLFQAVIELMGDHCETVSLPNTEKIGFVFDRNTTFAGRAVGIWNTIRSWTQFPRTEYLGTLTFGDRQRIKPLQAADCLAYESYRANEHFLTGQSERWQWTELKKLTDYRVFEKTALETLIALHERYPGGYLPTTAFRKISVDQLDEAMRQNDASVSGQSPPSAPPGAGA